MLNNIFKDFCVFQVLFIMLFIAIYLSEVNLNGIQLKTTDDDIKKESKVVKEKLLKARVIIATIGAMTTAIVTDVTWRMGNSLWKTEIIITVIFLIVMAWELNKELELESKKSSKRVQKVKKN